jgi:hypothetical protein
VKGDAWKNIISYNVLSRHDTLTKTHNGAFYNNLNRFDLFNKKFEEVETKLNEVWTGFDLIEQGEFNTKSMIDDMSSAGSTNYMVFVDGSRPDTHIDYLGQKTAFATLLFQQIIEAELHGDSTLEAGQVLYLDIKKATGLTGDEPDQQDNKQTGYHMITKLAYHITIGNEPTLRVSCEMVKGAVRDIKGRL